MTAIGSVGEISAPNSRQCSSGTVDADHGSTIHAATPTTMVDARVRRGRGRRPASGTVGAGSGRCAARRRTAAATACPASARSRSRSTQQRLGAVAQRARDAQASSATSVARRAARSPSRRWWWAGARSARSATPRARSRRGTARRCRAWPYRSGPALAAHAKRSRLTPALFASERPFTARRPRLPAFGQRRGRCHRGHRRRGHQAVGIGAGPLCTAAGGRCLAG